MAYNYQGALKAGASEDQVLDYLTKTRKYDVQGAVGAGATKMQVIDYLSKTNSPADSGIDNTVKKDLMEPPPEKQSVWDTNPILKSISSLGNTAKSVIPATGEVGGSAALGFAQNLVDMPNKIASLVSKITGAPKPPTLLPQIQNIKAPNEMAQNIGKGAEQVTEFVLPQAAVTKGIKAVEGATKAAKFPKILQDVLNMAGKMGIEGSSAAGVTAVQGGDKKQIEDAAIYGGVLPIAGSLAKKAGQGLKSVGSKIEKSIIRPTKVDIEDGFDVKNVWKHDLGGTLNDTLVKVNNKMNQLSQQLADKIGQSKEQINLNEIYDKTIKKLTDNKAKNFGNNVKIQNVLSGLKEEIKSIGDSIDLATAQSVKRGSGTMGAWKFGAQDPESKAIEKVYNAFYNTIKTEIENKSPKGIKEINKQLSELIPIHNAVIRRLPVEQRNYAIGLTDFMGLGASIINPKVLPFEIVNYLSKSGRAAKSLYNLGDLPEKGKKITPLVKGAIIKGLSQ